MFCEKKGAECEWLRSVELMVETTTIDRALPTANTGRELAASYMEDVARKWLQTAPEACSPDRCGVLIKVIHTALAYEATFEMQYPDVKN